ncbi:MAG: sulfatase, partial [Planctomycetota bacterium]
EASTPNVIIVFCDDQGYQDLGCFGSKHIETPNIDRLAKEGMRFTDFYSAYCVCSASRASLLTGSYQPRISMKGVLGPRSRIGLHPDEVTIADLLKTKGYSTGAVGKWHVGDAPETLPAAQGFDSYLGLPYSNDMARTKGWGNGPADLDKIWKLKKWDIYNNNLYRNRERIEGPVNQVTMTDRYTDECVRFIRAHAKKPFFLYMAHSMPHVPLFVSDERYKEDPHLAYKLTIEHIDASVGRITKTLDELNLAKNTLIVYTSDNGPWLSKKHHGGSALPLRAGKGTTYEGGMRVPCVMRWPARILPGQTCEQVAGTIDLIPTIAAIVGAKLPADRPIDGLDISALFDDPSKPSPHDAVGYYYYKNNKPQAIRMGRWKLHLKKNAELYDLRADIGESKNVASANSEVVERLRGAASRYDADLQANKRPIWGTPNPKKRNKNRAKKRNQQKRGKKAEPK